MRKIKLLLVGTLLVMLPLGAHRVHSASEDTGEAKQVEASTQKIDDHDSLVQALPKTSSSSDWNLILINRDKPLLSDLRWPTELLPNGIEVDQRLIKPIQVWSEQAAKDGHDMAILSGYRSIGQQKANFQSSLNDYLAQGYSQEDAEEKVQELIQPEGASEHHSGLAIDVISQSYLNMGGNLNTDFENQPAYDYYVSTMADHGFILRYPRDKEAITGINFEPWHYRYVGVENAKFMTDHNLCLEEYVDLLKTREERRSDD